MLKEQAMFSELFCLHMLIISRETSSWNICRYISLLERILYSPWQSNAECKKWFNLPHSPLLHNILVLHWLNLKRWRNQITIGTFGFCTWCGAFYNSLCMEVSNSNLWLHDKRRWIWFDIVYFLFMSIS